VKEKTMKRTFAIAAAAAVLATSLAVPQFAAAQSTRTYGSGDICREARRESGHKGAIVGGVLGAVLGSQVAGKGAKTEGAVLGGVVGAAAGNQVGRNRINCKGYPSRVAQTSYSRNNCQWVSEYYGGRDHSFEVCRGRDGVWRPSGRS
jgi:uncharacterized protein YcfJ